MASANRSTGRLARRGGSSIRHPCHTALSAIAGALLVLGAACALGADPEPDDEPVTAASQTVFATILYKLPTYVDWPTNHPPATNAWHIGLLGASPLDSILEKSLKGRTQQQRPFAIHRAAVVEDLPYCHIVFVALKTRAERHAALKKLNGRPTLTVSPEPGFLDDSGVIRLRVRRTVQMDINLDQARTNGIGIQTRLLEIAYEVMENGEKRKLR